MIVDTERNSTSLCHGRYFQLTKLWKRFLLRRNVSFKPSERSFACTVQHYDKLCFGMCKYTCFTNDLERLCCVVVFKITNHIKCLVRDLKWRVNTSSQQLTRDEFVPKILIVRKSLKMFFFITKHYVYLKHVEIKMNNRSQEESLKRTFLPCW